jgi:RNA polymerase sigma factor (sigma-70 family)
MTTQTPIKKSTVHITKEEERELIRQYQENKDNDALQRLLDVHNPYVQKLAGVSFKQFNKIIDFEDLVQQARLGLIKAAKQFDLEKTVTDENSPNYGGHLRFLTYAHQWMIAQMQDAWHHAHAVHIPAHTLRAIHFKSIQNPADLKAQARIKLATLAMKPESYDAMVENFRNKESGSSNSFEISLNQNGVRVQDPTFEEGMKELFSPNVTEAIKRLTESEWKIFQMKVGLDGMKFPIIEIAKRMDMSVTEVDKQYKRAKRILTKYIDVKKTQ